MKRVPLLEFLLMHVKKIRYIQKAECEIEESKGCSNPSNKEIAARLRMSPAKVAELKKSLF